MIYSNKIIQDYIKGKKISEYDIKELENNPSFMKQVIQISKNKEIYNKCSEELKGNYEFVKSVVKDNIKDILFVEKMVSNFIMHNKNINESVELTLLMLNNTPYEERNLSNCIDVYSFYRYYMKQVNIALNNEENYDILDELGKGFIFLSHEFSGYENIIEFFAIEFINEIFEEDLEKIIHKNFRKKEELEKIGLNNFLLNYINSKDYTLSNYISIRLYLLDEIKEEITDIKNNWDNYMNNLNKKRKTIIENYIKTFTKSTLFNNTFNCYKELNDILKELTIDFDLSDYDLKDTDTLTTKKCININKALFKKKIKELIKILYKVDYIDTNKLKQFFFHKKNNKTKALILKFNNNN